jgi:hypothetical protein
MALVKPNDFAPATVAESAKVDANFDLLYNLLNGTSTDADAIIRLNHATLPTLRIDQLGTGPILVLRQNLSETFKVLVDGKVYHAAIIDVNGNEELAFISVASAVNEIAVRNAAASNRPALILQGGDANVGLDVITKGTGEVRLNCQLELSAVDPPGNNYASRKTYVDTRRTRWSASFYISDPATRGIDGDFSEVQGVWVPGANFVATHIGAKFTHGSASGSFTIEFRKQPFGSSTQTNLGSIAFNSGTINVGIESDIGDHTFTANDFVYVVITAASSPLQKSVWCSIRGYQTPENP